MGDVSDILGVKKEKDDKKGVPLSALAGDSGRRKKPAKTSRPPNVSREVYALMGFNAMPAGDAGDASTNPLLPSMAPAAGSMQGFKDKRSGIAQKWQWAPYQNSARTDGVEFSRWHKVGVDYMDYPYARFNVRLSKLEYTDEEYELHLQDPSWTRSDTDKLVALCARYDLRWPVIADRYNQIPRRSMEQLQHRYYTMAQKVLLVRRRIYEAEEDRDTAGLATGKDRLEAKAQALGVSLHVRYNLEFEMERRRQLDALFKRTREDEKSETQLKEELKQVEAELRRLRKEITTAEASQPAPRSAAASSALAQGPAIPRPGRPFLMSSRLALPEEKPALGKQMLNKLTFMLQELKVPERPMPTRNVCDLFDNLRRDIVALLSLRKFVDKAGSEVQGLRRELRALDAPPAASSSASSQQAAAGGGSSSASTSSSAAPSEGGGSKKRKSNNAGSGGSKGKRSKKH
uniref:Myb-like domain-containing protein n=1 Tax=Rhizochromulina marina TaxID=1034831 RepID=A0A7S2S7D5_9STRA